MSPIFSFLVLYLACVVFVILQIPQFGSFGKWVRKLCATFVPNFGTHMGSGAKLGK